LDVIPPDGLWLAIQASDKLPSSAERTAGWRSNPGYASTGPQTFQAADAEAEQGTEALTCWNGAAKMIRGRSIKHTSI